MHEFSLVMNIVDIACETAMRNGATSVEAIDLEIGELAGIDWSALDFAWKNVIPNTILAHAKWNIDKIRGQVECMECGNMFHTDSLYAPCPKCNQYITEVRDGRQFRIKSITVH